MRRYFILFEAYVFLALWMSSLQAEDGLNIDVSLSDEKLYAFIFDDVPVSEPLLKTLAAFREQESAEVSESLDGLTRQLEELCLNNPENTELFSYLGWIAFMRRDYQKAYLLLEKACLSLNSQRCNDWRRLAVLEGIQNPKSPKQWQFFEKALELKPDDYDTFFLRGIARLGIGEYQKALDDFNRGIEIKDNFEIRGLRGFAYFGLGHIPQAIADFERYLSAIPNPEQPLLFKCLAIGYWQNQQYPLAFELLEKAEILFPDNPDFSLMRFVIYLPCGNTHECQKAIEKCLKTMPDTPKVQLFEALWQTYNDNGAQGMKKLPQLEAMADKGLISPSIVDLLWTELAIQNYEQTQLFFKSAEFSPEDSARFLKKFSGIKNKLSEFPNKTTVFQIMDIQEVLRMFL